MEIFGFPFLINTSYIPLTTIPEVVVNISEGDLEIMFNTTISQDTLVMFPCGPTPYQWRFIVQPGTFPAYTIFFLMISFVKIMVLFVQAI